MRIVIDDLTGPDIAALLEAHVAELRTISPPESKHALDLDGLRQPCTTMWSAWDDDELVGCAALKDLGMGQAELKSMRVASVHQGKGIATALLKHLLTEAKGMGFTRIWLETGSMEFFAPARSLYLKHGFQLCGPFGPYQEDPNSVFMTREIDSTVQNSGLKS